jgi:hypothetical protein
MEFISSQYMSSISCQSCKFKQININSCQFMSFHVNSCHLCHLCHSCQFTSIHVNSCQFMLIHVILVISCHICHSCHVSFNISGNSVKLGRDGGREGQMWFPRPSATALLSVLLRQPLSSDPFFSAMMHGRHKLVRQCFLIVIQINMHTLYYTNSAIF